MGGREEHGNWPKGGTDRTDKRGSGGFVSWGLVRVDVSGRDFSLRQRADQQFRPLHNTANLIEIRSRTNGARSASIGL